MRAARLPRRAETRGWACGGSEGAGRSAGRGADHHARRRRVRFRGAVRQSLKRLQHSGSRIAIVGRFFRAVGKKARLRQQRVIALPLHFLLTLLRTQALLLRLPLALLGE